MQVSTQDPVGPALLRFVRNSDELEHCHVAKHLYTLQILQVPTPKRHAKIRSIITVLADTLSPLARQKAAVSY